MAWQAEQADRCPTCGHPRDETMAPDAEGAYVARPLRCQACAARSTAAENWDGPSGGLYWAVDRRPDG